MFRSLNLLEHYVIITNLFVEVIDYFVKFNFNSVEISVTTINKNKILTKYLLKLLLLVLFLANLIIILLLLSTKIL